MDKDELLKYMPDYYNGVYEMEELLKAQSKGLYQFDGEINRTLLNEFIIQADEKGISVFEDQAGIKPDSDASLETRRNDVLLRLLPPKPLTTRYLNHLLEIMNLKADVKVDYAKYLKVEKDSWKEDFLLQIESKAIPVTKFADDNKYKIWGFHFFNRDVRTVEFDSDMKKL